METIAIIILSLGSIYYIFKYGKQYTYYVLIFNILVDILSLFSIAGGSIALIRGAVLFIFFIYIFLNFNKINNPILIILIYTVFGFILVMFSSNFAYSLRTYARVIISILYFCIGYIVVVDITKLRKLTKSLIWVMILMILNTLIVNLWGIKVGEYNEDQLMSSGNLYGQVWNVATYCLLLLPLLNHFLLQRLKKYFIWTIAFTLFVLMLFNLSRIPVISLLFGYLVFFTFTKFKRRIFRIIVPTILFGMIISSFFWDIYIKQIELRKERYELSSYKTEARYLETFYVFDEIFKSKSLSKVLFGKEFLNSPGNYAGGMFGDRQLHSDYNNLLHGSGVVGILLYFAIYISIYVRYLKIKKALPENNITIDLLKSIFHVLILVPFIMSISGQMYIITFRTIGFIFLGAILSVLTNISHGKTYYRRVIKT